MRIVWVGLVSALILLICNGVVFSQNNISVSLSLEKGVAGYYVKSNSLSHKFANESITIYEPNGKIIKMNNSDTSVLPTPAGKMVTATHIFTVPSGSIVRSKSKANSDNS